MPSDVRIWDGTAWVSLKGPEGPAGPIVVSANAGNLAKLGTDNRVLVAQSDLDARYVNVTGDTMTGPLLAGPGRNLFTANNEAYSIGARRTAAGGYVYFGATDATATPGIQLSLAGGGSALTISNAGNITNAGTAHSFAAGSIASTAISGLPAASAVAGAALAATGAVGTSTAYARADHSHPLPALKADDLSDVAVTSPATGQVLRWNGTNFVNAALAYADITGTPPAGTTINPSTTAGLASTAGGTVGVSALYARADHTHPAQALKVDDLTDATVSAPATGQVLKWNGAAFVNDQIAYADILGTPTIPAAITPSSLTPLGNADVAVVGVSDQYARADHVHPTAPSGPTCNFYQASRIIDATDLGKLIVNNSGATADVTFTMPDDSLFPVGTRLDFFDASSTAKTWIQAPAGGQLVYSSTLSSGGGAGTAVTNTGRFQLADPYARVTALKTQANRWILFT